MHKGSRRSWRRGCSPSKCLPTKSKLRTRNVAQPHQTPARKHRCPQNGRQGGGDLRRARAPCAGAAILCHGLAAEEGCAAAAGGAAGASNRDDAGAGRHHRPPRRGRQSAGRRPGGDATPELAAHQGYHRHRSGEAYVHRNGRGGTAPTPPCREAPRLLQEP